MIREVLRFNHLREYLGDRMECLHKNISNKTVEKIVFDSKFKHKTLVCKDCEAHLRDHAYEKAYMHWLENIYKKRRDKFQLQCHFSKKLIKCVDVFLEDYPGISSTVFIKILAIIYLDFVDKNRKLATQFGQLLDSQIYDSFDQDKDRKKVNIQLKPKMMIELIAIAELMEEKPASLAETAVIKMVTAITSQDKNLREFWKKEIQNQLELFLKAA